MDDSFAIEVITPAGIALQDRASQVTLVTKDGEIGILPNHTKYTGLLGIGVLEYLSSSTQSPVQLVISKGFCTFADDTLRLLTDSVDLREGVDRDNYAANRSELIEIVQNGDTASPEWKRAREQLDRLEAIDRLISH